MKGVGSSALRQFGVSAVAVCAGLAALATLPDVSFAAEPATGAGATAADNGPPTEVAETVVTARRVAENVQKVPIAVTAFSQQTLASMAVEHIDDLNKLSAGLQTSPSAGGRQNFIPIIRGYSVSGGGGAANSVIPYFAEVPNFQISFYDLESLQVLEGPQSTLFGETAVGGALLFGPKKPQNQFGGYLDVQGGNYNYTSVEFAIGGPLVEDKLLWRLAGQIRKRNGWVTSIASYSPGTTVDLENTDTTDWRASLTWRPTPNIENYLMVNYATRAFNGTSNPLWYFNPAFINPFFANQVPNPIAFQYYAGYTPPAGLTWTQLQRQAYLRQIAAGPFLTFNDFNRRQLGTNAGFIDQAKWQVLPNLTVRNIFGVYWSAVSGGGVTDVDGSDLPVVDTNQFKYIPGISRSPWIGGWPNRIFSDELQVQGKAFNDRLTYQAGLYYRDANVRQWQPSTGQIVVYAVASGIPGSAATCTPLGYPGRGCTPLTRSDSVDYAFYGQGTFAVTDAIHLTAGFRRSYDSRKTFLTAGVPETQSFGGMTFPIAVIDNPIYPGATVVTQAVPLTGQNTYTLEGDWQINNRTLVYVTNRTGYKVGGINAVAPIGSPQAVYSPEHIIDTEFGLKTEFDIMGVRARINTDVWIDHYSNIQENTLINGTATTIIFNTGDVKNSGFELTADIFPTKWLELYGYFTYIDAYYTQWIQPSTCAAEYERPQCAGLPTTDLVNIDHAHGVVTVYNGATSSATINSVVYAHAPDPISYASKIRWAFQPKLHLEPLIGEDITIAANIYAYSKFMQGNGSYVQFAGQIATANPVGIFQGADPYALLVPGQTLVDLRLDWRHIRRSHVSLGVSVTNLMNLVYMENYGNPLGICGCTGAVVGAPRMWDLELHYDF